MSSVRILTGDVREQLATLPAASVQVVCTSPPYYRLRDYGVAGQIGMEETPAAFVATLVAVFDEVRRVLRPDGVVFCNLADSYAGSGKGPSKSMNAPTGGANPHSMGLSPGYVPPGTRAKSLMLIPQRFAIAMQDAGWIVRDEIVWAKKSAMPESVRDRCTKAWEPIFMFTRQGRYYWDQEAVRQPNTELTIARHANAPASRYRSHRGVGTIPPGHPTASNPTQHHAGSINVNGGGVNGANLRNVWSLSPSPSREPHYASFPPELPRRCILAATSERGQCPACGSPWIRVVERTAMVVREGPGRAGLKASATNGIARTAVTGTMLSPPSSQTTGWEPSCTCDAGDPVPQLVLDPFLGTGTTLLVASRLGRDGVGIELSPTYVEIARRRITDDAPMFADVEVA